MEATVNHRETHETIKIAVETFEVLDVFMDAKHEDIVRRITKERLAKAWLSSTKKALIKRLASDTIVKDHGQHDTTPEYFYWADRKLTEAKVLERRWLAAKTKMDASAIVLDNSEIDLLSEAVTIAHQLLQGTKC